MIRIIYLVLFILGGAIYGSAAADSIFSKNENGLQVRLTVVGGKIQIRNIQETDIEFLLNIYDIHKNPHYSDKRGRNTEQISGMLVTSLDHFKNGRPRGWFIGVEVSTGKPLIGIRFGGGDRSGAADIDAVTTEPDNPIAKIALREGFHALSREIERIGAGGDASFCCFLGHSLSCTDDTLSPADVKAWQRADMIGFTCESNYVVKDAPLIKQFYTNEVFVNESQLLERFAFFEEQLMGLFDPEKTDGKPLLMEKDGDARVRYQVIDPLGKVRTFSFGAYHPEPGDCKCGAPYLCKCGAYNIKFNIELQTYGLKPIIK